MQMRYSKFLALGSAAAIAVGVAACGSSDDNSSTGRIGLDRGGTSTAPARRSRHRS